MKSIGIKPAMHITSIEECSLTVIANDVPVYSVRFGREKPSEAFYTLFTNPLYIVPGIATRKQEGTENVIEIEFFAALNSGK